ncbi:MAG: stress response translation initiation inhibitor YciH [Calditrichae bacterium]|nr:stress response translation initiation inhibitor YciH [Calditrichia bacterium]
MKYGKKNKGSLVYSTESGRIKSDQGKTESKASESQIDGIVRVRREVKGRGGKTVTTIIGLPLEEKELKELSKELKQRCGSGGSVKKGIVVIQGNQREMIVSILEDKGYIVKLAGG